MAEEAQGTTQEQAAVQGAPESGPQGAPYENPFASLEGRMGYWRPEAEPQTAAPAAGSPTETQPSTEAPPSAETITVPAQAVPATAQPAVPAATSEEQKAAPGFDIVEMLKAALVESPYEDGETGEPGVPAAPEGDRGRKGYRPYLTKVDREQIAVEPDAGSGFTKVRIPMPQDPWSDEFRTEEYQFPGVLSEEQARTKAIGLLQRRRREFDQRHEKQKYQRTAAPGEPGYEPAAGGVAPPEFDLETLYPDNRGRGDEAVLPGGPRDARGFAPETSIQKMAAEQAESALYAAMEQRYLSRIYAEEAAKLQDAGETISEDRMDDIREKAASRADAYLKSTKGKEELRREANAAYGRAQESISRQVAESEALLGRAATPMLTPMRQLLSRAERGQPLSSGFERDVANACLKGNFVFLGSLAMAARQLIDMHPAILQREKNRAWKEGRDALAAELGTRLGKPVASAATTAAPASATARAAAESRTGQAIVPPGGTAPGPVEEPNPFAGRSADEQRKAADEWRRNLLAGAKQR